MRSASITDAEAIAAIHVEGFEDAYRGLVPDEAIDVRSVGVRERQWRERLADLGDREFVIVAERGDEVVGFASGRAATPDEGGDGERIGCWENMYLRPDVIGTATGLKTGLALHEGTLERLSENGFGEAVNFVIEGNDRARRFFEAVGWLPDGFDRETEGIVQHRHRRTVATITNGAS